MFRDPESDSKVSTFLMSSSGRLSNFEIQAVTMLVGESKQVFVKKIPRNMSTFDTSSCLPMDQGTLTSGWPGAFKEINRNLTKSHARV